MAVAAFRSAAPAAGMSTPGRRFREGSAASMPEFDVFISYRRCEPDAGWVRAVLVPQLLAAGLAVCVDYRSFRLGRPLVLEMARAVEASRYTVAVLTPRYLESSFTELENVLAEHLGLEEAAYRLVAVLRERCEPRLGMRARLMLDMTSDNVAEPLERLVRAVRSDPAAP
jgi:hypothetical protein